MAKLLTVIHFRSQRKPLRVIMDDAIEDGAQKLWGDAHVVYDGGDGEPAFTIPWSAIDFIEEVPQ